MKLLKLAKDLDPNVSKICLIDIEGLEDGYNLKSYDSQNVIEFNDHDEFCEFACENPYHKVININIKNNALLVYFTKNELTQIDLDDFVDLLHSSDRTIPFILLATEEGTQKIISINVCDELSYDFVEDFAFNYEANVEMITYDNDRNFIVVCTTDKLGFYKLNNYTQIFFDKCESNFS